GGGLMSQQTASHGLLQTAVEADLEKLLVVEDADHDVVGMGGKGFEFWRRDRAEAGDAGAAVRGAGKDPHLVSRGEQPGDHGAAHAACPDETDTHPHSSVLRGDSVPGGEIGAARRVDGARRAGLSAGGSSWREWRRRWTARRRGDRKRGV